MSPSVRPEFSENLSIRAQSPLLNVMKCEVRGAKPKARIIWKDDLGNTVISADKTTSKTRGKLTDTFGSLTLKNLQKENHHQVYG